MSGRPAVRRAATIALVAFVAAGVAGVFVLLGRAASAPAESAPVASSWPFTSPAASVSSGPAAAPSSARVRLSSPAAPSTSAAAPEPFVQTFAPQPGARPLTPLPSPTDTQSVPVYADGCDHAYGTRTQCVPLTFPPGVTDKCAWLGEHGFTRLVVAGRDRQHLDPDHDGIAC